MSCTGSRTYTLRVDPSRNILAVVPGAGIPGIVRYFEPNGSLVPNLDFAPFTTSWTGGVTVALGDFTNDGIPDTVVGVGPGGTPIVNAYDGATHVLIATVPVFEPTFTGPGVRVFDAATASLLHQFFAYPETFLGGVFVAAADLTADGYADIVVGPGTGGAPLVRAFNGVTLAEIRQFFAFDLGFVGGVRVAASDLTGDRHAEIVTAAGPGGAPAVKILHGTDNTELASFLAYPAGVTSGVYVAAPTWPRRPTVDL